MTFPAPRRLFYGWVIVAVVMMAQALVVGVHTSGFGFFFKPMSDELGWSRSLLSGVVGVRHLVAAVLAVPLGFLLDRYGPRAIISVGVLVGSLGTMASGTVQGIWQFYLLYGVLGAVGMSVVESNIVSSSVAKWFVRRRGRAMGIDATAVPISGILVPPLIFLLLSTLGWRLSWLCIGLVIMLAVVPAAALLLRRQPEDMGLLPDGDEARNTGGGSVPEPPAALERSWTVHEALRTRTLWLVVFGLNLGGIAQSALFVHLIPYLSDQGFSDANAALVVTLIGVGALVNKPFWGLLAERFPLRYLIATAFTIHGFGLLVLIVAKSLPVLLLYAGITGLTRTLGLWMSLVYANYFGRRHLGAIRGVTAPIQAVGFAMSPIFAGVMYDATGSYVVAFELLTGLVFLAAVLMLLAKPPVPVEQHRPPTEAVAGHESR